MARRRKNRSRDTSRIANEVASDYVVVEPSNLLTEVEDRRSYHPLHEDRPAKAFRRAQHVLVDRVDAKRVGRRQAASSLFYEKFAKRIGRVRPRMVTSRVAFDDSKNVLICVRRKRRREVLHALKRAGRGNRSPRWNEWSKVRC